MGKCMQNFICRPVSTLHKIRTVFSSQIGSWLSFCFTLISSFDCSQAISKISFAFPLIHLICLLLHFKNVHAIESQAKITYDRAHLRAWTFGIKWKSLVFHLWRLGRIVCAADAAGLLVLHCKCRLKVHFSPVQREVFATVLHANWTLQYFLCPAVRVSAAH